MKVGFIPQYIDSLGDNELFEFDGYDPTDAYGADRVGFAAAAKRLRSEGHEVTTIDRCDPSELDVCVFIDMNFDYLDMLLSSEDTPRLVYIHREPPSVRWYNTSSKLPTYARLFDAVVSWNGDIARGVEHAHEYNIPQYLETEPSGVEFEEQSLLVNISSRKYSSHPEELYSSREDIIQYFDRHHPSEFNLYGLYWNQRPRPEDVYHHHVVNPPTYQTYGGIIDSKTEAYHNHRFALCFENMTGIPGYVTEKIFDCLRAGVVPVYWGATDVDDYIPEDLYVDYRKYGTPYSLYEYLSNVEKDEYEAYIDSAKNFLENDAQHVGPSQYADVVFDAVTSKQSGRELDPTVRRKVEVYGIVERLENRPDDVSASNRLRELVHLGMNHSDVLVSNPSSIINTVRSFF